MSSERRRHPRYPQQLQALLILPDGHHMTANTTDLSHGGARVVTKSRLPAGVHILMEITPPSPPVRSIFKLWANTLHSQPLTDGPGFGMGMEFTNPPIHYRRLIMMLNGRP